MASELGHLLEVCLQQLLRQLDEDRRRKEEHDLPDDVGAAESLDRLD